MRLWQAIRGAAGKGEMQMRIKKMKVCFVILIILLACLISGCGKSYDDILENHAAIEMYRDGVWSVRYISENTIVPSGNVESVMVQLSVNVDKEMTEEQMLEVMDYYEFTRNALFEKGEYKGEQDADYSCYAVFYRGDTDEEIFRIKYQNGKETEPTEEEESVFPMSGMHTDEVGEDP